MNRGKERTATIISFRLSRPARLELVVRGPGPNCDVTGRITIAGRSGANRLRFNGAIRKRRLQPGTYLLVTQMKATREPLASTYVVIDAPGAPRTPRVLPLCSPPSVAVWSTLAVAPWSTLADAALAPLGDTLIDIAPLGDTLINVDLAAANGSARNQLRRNGVLGVQSPPQDAGLPELSTFTTWGASRSTAELLLLAVMLGLGLPGIALLVASFRSSRRARIYHWY
ncbi:MAG TPA: hypothetical protein VGP30_05490 [Candidatus Limnocylindrales bacterium]|nr:hypothetical protein [Candidatus Limnocylindrales bacterium]